MCIKNLIKLFVEYAMLNVPIQIGNVYSKIFVLS